MNDTNKKFMQLAIETARKARVKGNHPFGAVLVDAEGNGLLTGENSVVTEKDCTGHAELNLMREASMTYDREFLAGCTLYASTEPCPMCAGAIFWGDVHRVVFGLSQQDLYDLVGEGRGDAIHLSCRDFFEKGNKPVEVVGPLLEEEARAVHDGFW